MRLVPLHLAIATAVVGLASPMAMAEPAPVGPVVQVAEDMPLADYLALLAQIAPAAHGAAQAFLHAFEQRCGRALKTVELRRSMSEGDGDPVLMGMIRASHLRDANGLAQLGRRVVCDQRSAP